MTADVQEIEDGHRKLAKLQPYDGTDRKAKR